MNPSPSTFLPSLPLPSSTLTFLRKYPPLPRWGIGQAVAETEERSETCGNEREAGNRAEGLQIPVRKQTKHGEKEPKRTTRDLPKHQLGSRGTEAYARQASTLFTFPSAQQCQQG